VLTELENHCKSKFTQPTGRIRAGANITDVGDKQLTPGRKCFNWLMSSHSRPQQQPNNG